LPQCHWPTYLYYRGLIEVAQWPHHSEWIDSNQAHEIEEDLEEEVEEDWGDSDDEDDDEDDDQDQEDEDEDVSAPGAVAEGPKQVATHLPPDVSSAASALGPLGKHIVRIRTHSEPE